MTKRIIAISNHGDMLGGGEHSFLDLVSHLPDNWKVLAILPQKGELTDRLSQKEMEVCIIPLPPIRPWSFIRIFVSLKSYFELFREYQPALIYTNGSRAALYGGIAGRILGLPIIWHCRVAETDIFMDFILARLSTVIIANSMATSKRFKPRFRAKITTIYNGINIDWIQNRTQEKLSSIESDWKIILIVARVSKWKRHDLALSAFEQVAKSNPNAHLICVGAKDRLEMSWWEYLQKKTHQSLFSDRIHWVDQVEDIRPWYWSSTVLLLPSYNEPFGRVLVEAMACGIPVIATRSGGVPEIVRHGLDGLLVEPGCVDEMANAMANILKDDTIRKRFSESAKQRAESFSLDVHLEKMVRLFEYITDK